jgi:hypothetical protein
VPFPDQGQALRSCLPFLQPYFPRLQVSTEQRLLSTWVAGDRSGFPVRRRLALEAAPRGAGTELALTVAVLRVGVSPFASPRWVEGGADRELEDEIIRVLKDNLAGRE